MPEGVLEALQATTVAGAVGGSIMLTAALSALHLVGLTLVTGSAFVTALGLAGRLRGRWPPSDLTHASRRVLLGGALLSVGSGLLLAAPRAVAAAENDIFRTKMLLLAVALACHAAMHGAIRRRLLVGRAWLGLTGLTHFALWFAVAAAGCAYILLE